ncbi:proteasomal ubiquitin receptor ADRM1-like [Haliotis rufescens]|uniref:proteasomal ubiquitin receptor ADRM1-like n=1 Tax=Haliotis rufescens TaxID=6454 RepID=UPI001EB02EBA|nr:proteasomal ubiquitin receptor ADRM1-like [Haliotis rufescens]
MAALFGTSTSGRTQSKNLVEFRAGKMYMKEKMVHPDKRKGQVYVYQSDDSLMHFCWKDRTSGNVEDDLIIFPDDIEFKHVPQCTTGRVYVLKFKSSTRKMIFWMQEPKSDKDEEHCKKVNEYLNNPPTPGSSRGAGGSGLPSELSGLGEQDLQSILGGMSQQQLMQLLGGVGVGGPGGGLPSLMVRPGSAQSTVSEPPMRAQSSSGSRSTATADSVMSQPRPLTAAALPSQPAASTATPVTPSSSGSGTGSSGTGSSGTGSGGTGSGGGSSSSSSSTAAASTSGGAGRPQIQLSDLQNILSTMNVPASQKEGLDLAQALSPEAMIPLLANPDIQKKLVEFLPEGESLPKTETELKNTIQSPQFSQALTSFSAALQSGQLGPLMTQFGLGEDVANAAAEGDLEAFVKAMQEGMKKKNKEEDKDKDKGEEKMEQ